MPSPPPYLPIPVAPHGVRSDLPQMDIGPGFLAASENWVYRDGIFRTRPGFAGIANYTTVGFRIQGITQFLNTDGTLYTVFPTAKSGMSDGHVYVSDGTGTTDLSGSLTGGDLDLIAMRSFTSGTDNFLILVNNVDPTLVWDGDTGDAAEAIPDAPAARAVMILANRVVLCGLPAVHPSMVAPSAEFDHTTGYSDNRVVLGDTPGEIVAALERGNFQGTIFKSDSLWTAEFTGAQDPFAYRLIQVVPGPVSTLAVANLNFGRLQVYLGNDANLYLFDGYNATPVNRRIQKYLLDTWNPFATGRVTMFYDPEQVELHILYPEVGQADNNLELVVKMPSGDFLPQRLKSAVGATAGYYFTVGAKIDIQAALTIGELTMPIGEMTATIGELAGVHPRVVMAAYITDPSPDAQLLQFSADSDAPAFFESALFLMDKNLGFVLLDEIKHFLTASSPATAQIQVGTSDYGAERVLSAPIAAAVSDGGSDVETGLRDASRYFSLRVSVAPTFAAKSTFEWAGSFAHPIYQAPR